MKVFKTDLGKTLKQCSIQALTLDLSMDLLMSTKFL